MIEEHYWIICRGAYSIPQQINKEGPVFYAKEPAFITEITRFLRAQEAVVVCEKLNKKRPDSIFAVKRAKLSMEVADL